MSGRKCFEICYHEVLGRTVYVMADNAEEARVRAEDHFMDNPLTYDDFVDSSTDTDEVNPQDIDPREILGDEKVMPHPVDAITNNPARVRPHVELIYNWLVDEFRKNGWTMPENPYMAADVFWDVIGKLITKLRIQGIDNKIADEQRRNT